MVFFEDHPGLNPSSERIVELQSDIHAKLGELMINRSPQDVLVAAEALHGESNDIPFMESLLNDLNINGVQGEAFKDALDLAGIVPSPLEQFSILPLIPMNIGKMDFSFTNPSLSMLLTLSLVLLLVHFVTKNGGGNSVPNAWQSLVELIHDFVPNPKSNLSVQWNQASISSLSSNSYPNPRTTAKQKE
ncbi:ATP synthase F0 subunit 6 mitochondrion [Cinnamomum micranthum f. kanehirae]|uniref:F-ATPase protein 6 n=1 Tax=Cinnamomum micranthum f. kanehirae TaxID=337451 RepID=A0A443Q3V9_9MAGN|nr:ATP synthase F0 subunit 6 mitochondrion [Cinnamomum micranthum f. kanehirae]